MIASSARFKNVRFTSLHRVITPVDPAGGWTVEYFGVRCLAETPARSVLVKRQELVTWGDACRNGQFSRRQIEWGEHRALLSGSAGRGLRFRVPFPVELHDLNRLI